MAAPKARRNKVNEHSGKLLEALNVIARAQDKGGGISDQHCRIQSGWLLASNGKLSVGLKIPEDFECNPHTEKLMLALSKTKEQTTFTYQDKEGQLHIKSGKFQVNVPCVASEYLPTIVPDIPCAKITPLLLEALEVCANVANEAEEQPIFKGVWLDGYSCAASDRFTIIQFWHGIHLPSGFVIPKFAIKALGEHKAKLTEFGFSDRTVTFYYEDGAFVQTILYVGAYPKYTEILDQPYNYQPVPAEFYNGLAAILDFTDNGTVFFHQGVLSSEQTEGQGARYEVPGLSRGKMFNGERLKILEKYANAVDFYTAKGAAFVGERCRGIIAGRR